MLSTGYDQVMNKLYTRKNWIFKGYIVNSDQKINCPHFNLCSGCVRQDQVNQPTLYEEARLFFAKYQYELPPLVTGPAIGWRHRVKLVVAPSRLHPKKIAIGLYKAGSHEVEEIPHCQVHHPVLQQALSVIQKVLEQESISAYEEKRQTGLVRYLLLALEEESQSVQVTFVVTRRNPAFWQKPIQELIDQAPSLWHSIWLNQNERADNVIWGEEWDLLWGKPWLHTQIGLAPMALHPGSFFQANVPLFRQLVEELTTWMPFNSSLLELYSGCGVMGLHLAAARGCSVVFCERNPLSRLAFDASFNRMPPTSKQELKLQFLVESAEKALFLLEETECILVDPPRKGLAPELIKALGTCKKGMQLFYISCGWKAFMRDCDALHALGWRIKKAKSYLFFPGTEQIETLVQMEKE